VRACRIRSKRPLRIAGKSTLRAISFAAMNRRRRNWLAIGDLVVSELAFAIMTPRRQ
jgi:hypothetical protein